MRGIPWDELHSILPLLPLLNWATKQFLRLLLATPNRQSAPEGPAPGLTCPCDPTNPSTVQGHIIVIKGKHQVIAWLRATLGSHCLCPSYKAYTSGPLVDRASVL